MRTKKAIKNISASMLYQIVALICGLITPRLILSTFGSTYNGVVASATQFLSMISILNLGIAGPTRVALYKTLAANDVEGTSRIMRATKNYMRKVAIILIGYVALLCLIYPFISHNDLSHKESALLIGIVSLGAFADYFFGISNATLLSADQSGYISYIINIGKTIINTLLVAILIKMNCSIFQVKLGSSLVFFIAPFVLDIYVKRKYKLHDKCEPDYGAIKQRGAAAFHSIANIVHNNTDLIILTAFTDAKVISVYTVYYLVLGNIKQLTQVFTNGLEGGFGNMWVKKEYGPLQKNFRAFEYAMFSFVAVVFSCVGLLIIPFVAQYTRGVNDTNYILPVFAVLVTIAEAMYCIREPYLILVQATGSYEETKWGAMIEAIINIVVSVVLVMLIGINGVIIGTLIANTFRTIQYAIYISNHVLKRSIMDVVKRFVWMISTIAIILLVSKLSFLLPVLDGWLGWIVLAAVTFIDAAFVTIISGAIFYRNDFLYFCNVLKRMIRR